MMHLYLINDNENSFMHAYACLMKYAGHLPVQAEQCCLITDNVGRCHIKQGDFMELSTIMEDLAAMNLKVELKD